MEEHEAFSTTPYILAIPLGLVLLIGPIVFRALWSQVALSKIPLLGKEFGSSLKREQAYATHARELYSKGYNLFRSTAYRLTTSDGEKVILPPQFLRELRGKPDSVVSITKALDTVLESKYTGVKNDMPLLNHLVRADLTQSLTRVNARLSEEVTRSVETELPTCEDWTPVNVNYKLLRVVAIVSGHIFLGPKLCRSEEYIYSSIKFTVDIMDAVRRLKLWNTWLRFIGVFFNPPLKAIKDHHKRATAFLEPVISERRKAMQKGEEVPDDMLQWMLGKGEKYGIKDDKVLAHMQLILSMAAIHTTTTTLTNILYDLAIRPELIEVLRQEIRDVLSQNDGIFTVSALYQMKLVDSVMKESMRLNPQGFARFTRVIGESLTLSDGTFLPKNTPIEVPYHAITRDPEIYPNPDTFDPYRFYNLRRAGGEDANRHQFVTVTETSMGFGYGKHACPGRFFAANEIKLILANLLLQFDIKNKEGSMKRYGNIEAGGTEFPDPTRELLFKRVA